MSDGERLGVADAARCTIAWTWPDVKVVPAVRSTRIDAVVAGWFPMAKSLCWGTTRFTWADCTPWIDSIVCSSCPSRACWYSTCCTNSDVVMPLFSRFEKPTVPELGRPCSARATRSWSTSAAGTRTVAPPLLSS